MDILGILIGSLKITFFVFIMMVIIDIINEKTRGKAEKWMKKSVKRQYVGASFLGSTPGCLGAFASVAMYAHGLITFGAITGCMIATSGDESFVMLALFPKQAVLLFSMLFVFGIVFAYTTDKIMSKFRIPPCKCHLDVHEKPTMKDYWKKHIINHILKKHVWKVFLWTFFSLLFLAIFLEYFNLEGFISNHMVYILLISAVVGLIPESGPHMAFVFMFASGLIPFSVLLTSSMVQDGHGMLPMFAVDVRYSLLIKLFNIVYALGVGLTFYMIGF